MKLWNRFHVLWALVWCPIAVSFSPKDLYHPIATKTTRALLPSLHQPLTKANRLEDQHMGPYTTLRTSTTALGASSPLGIDELPSLVQASVFFGSYAGLGIGTVAGTKLLDVYSKNGLGLERWRNSFIDGITVQAVLGILYLVAGIGHFANAEGFRNIYPPMGTWGIWYLPGSASFHVAWTGVVEILGGSGLLYAAYQNLNSNTDDDDDDEALLPRLVQPLSAALLFVLTTVVTPANIYMFTHGATMGGDYGALGLDYHVARFGIQVLLLSLLLVLTKDSLFFVWSDELD